MTDGDTRRHIVTPICVAYQYAGGRHNKKKKKKKKREQKESTECQKMWAGLQEEWVGVCEPQFLYFLHAHRLQTGSMQY